VELEDSPPGLDRIEVKGRRRRALPASSRLFVVARRAGPGVVELRQLAACCGESEHDVESESARFLKHG
jgi:hypothetical protein